MSQINPIKGDLRVASNHQATKTIETQDQTQRELHRLASKTLEDRQTMPKTRSTKHTCSTKPTSESSSGFWNGINNLIKIIQNLFTSCLGLKPKDTSDNATLSKETSKKPSITPETLQKNFDIFLKELEISEEGWFSKKAAEIFVRDFADQADKLTPQQLRTFFKDYPHPGDIPIHVFKKFDIDQLNSVARIGFQTDGPTFLSKEIIESIPAEKFEYLHPHWIHSEYLTQDQLKTIISRNDFKEKVLPIIKDFNFGNCMSNPNTIKRRHNILNALIDCLTFDQLQSLEFKVKNPFGLNQFKEDFLNQTKKDLSEEQIRKVNLLYP